jgi:hypothetical protein
MATLSGATARQWRRPFSSSEEAYQTHTALQMIHINSMKGDVRVNAPALQQPPLEPKRSGWHRSTRALPQPAKIKIHGFAQLPVST